MSSETPESGDDHHQHPFLTYLRASNEDFGQLQALTAEGLMSRTAGADSEQDVDATIRSSNVIEAHQQKKSKISDLFVPPKSPSNTAILQNEEEKKSYESRRIGETVSDPKVSCGQPLEDSMITEHEPINIARPFLVPRPELLGNLDRGRSVVYKVDYEESINGDELHIKDNHNYGYYVQVADETTIGTQHVQGESSLRSIHSLSPTTKQRIVDTFLQQPRNDSIRASKRPEKIKRNDRAVSFDADVMQRNGGHVPAHSNPNYQDMNGPSLGANRTFGDITTNVKSDQRNNSRPRPMTFHDRAITLDTVLTAGRYELEAETNLLKALDDHQSAYRRRHQRLRSETSTILSGVPDSLGHDFTLDYEEGYDVITDHSTAKVGIKEGSFNSHRDSIVGRAIGDELTDLEEGMPLIKTEKRHRRCMTVEDRLAGLAVAYSNLDDNNGHAQSQQPIKASNRPADNGSSADAFRHNAALLSRLDDASSGKGRKHSDVADHLPSLEEGDEDAPQNGDEISSHSSFHSDTHHDSNRSSEVRHQNKGKRASLLTGAKDSLKDEWELWWTFFNPRKEHVVTYSKTVFLWMGIPLIGIATLLFYVFENPPTGLSTDGSSAYHASASWWLIYFLRQVITLSVALLLQIILVDFFSIGSRVMLKILGPIFTLLIVQSRGWPFVLFWWSMLDFAMLYGDRAFARNWLYWQDHVGLFNSQNPSGQVVNSTLNTQILSIVAIVSAAVAVKRFVVGLYLSRNTFSELIAKTNVTTSRICAG
jgi:hypothetical protein